MSKLTIQEAIEKMKTFKRSYSIKTNSTNVVEAFEMAIEALEKQIPQDVQVYVDGWDYKIDIFCPKCNHGIELDYFTKDGYCKCCGQKVKRKDIEIRDVINPIN